MAQDRFGGYALCAESDSSYGTFEIFPMLNLGIPPMQYLDSAYGIFQIFPMAYLSFLRYKDRTLFIINRVVFLYCVILCGCLVVIALQ